MHYTDMPSKTLRIHLLQAEISQADLARELGVSRSMITRVINGQVVSDRVRQHIATRIGVDVKRIWPSTYLYRQRDQIRSSAATISQKNTACQCPICE